jgi:hypothetical protein
MMKSKLIGWGGIILVLAIVSSYFLRSQSWDRDRSDAVTISFVEAIDYRPTTPKGSARCIFLFRLSNTYADVALVGPSRLRVANATIMKNIPSVTVDGRGSFDLSLPGRDDVPCSEYRMKPWLDASACVLTTGNECKVANIRGGDIRSKQTGTLQESQSSQRLNTREKNKTDRVRATGAAAPTAKKLLL